MRLTGGGSSFPVPGRRRTTSQAGVSPGVASSLRSAFLSPAALWALVGIVVLGLLFSFGVSLHGRDSASTATVQPLRLRRLQGGGGLQSLLSAGRSDRVRHDVAETRFGSIYHDQLLGNFKLDQGRAGGLTRELVAALKEMESPAGAGLTSVMFSSPWSWFELEQGSIRFDYLDWVAESACSNTGLKVAFLLDMVRAPAWVFKQWPDARAADSHGRKYELLSWFHADARKAALQVVSEVTKHLMDTHRDCVVAVQPVFNNEYEARYTQEHDCYQDYSAPAMTAFRTWLRSRRPRIEDMNARWGSAFGSWEELTPPVLEAGSFTGVDMSPRYWDFLHWREAAGAEVFNGACAAVQAAGALCFHHVPESFTVLDAVYGTSMIKHIAASPHTDFLIVGSGLRTPYGTVLNPTKLRMFVGAVASYGKPVHFEAAIRQDGGSSMAAYELLGSAARNALLAGARGLGVTGWLGRLKPDAQLAAALQPPPLECRGAGRGGELVGVFIHIDSCMAWHGLQWHSARKDPLHDFVQDLADTLSARCDTDVVVHVELERFAADLLGSSTGGGAGSSSSSRSGGRRFDRVIFVEPLVLTAKELDTYALVKAAVASLPPSRAAVMRLPANNTAGVLLQVHEEL